MAAATLNQQPLGPNRPRVGAAGARCPLVIVIMNMLGLGGFPHGSKLHAHAWHRTWTGMHGQLSRMPLGSAVLLQLGLLLMVFTARILTFSQPVSMPFFQPEWSFLHLILVFVDRCLVGPFDACVDRMQICFVLLLFSVCFCRGVRVLGVWPDPRFD
jgi:hypothetical protein